jgi:hypothetical protein
MQTRPPFPWVVARLVSAADAAARCYRPLVAGPALLERPPGRDAWTVAIACDRRLMPRAPGPAVMLTHRARGLTARGGGRIGVAVVGPLDALGPAVRRSAEIREPAPSSRLRLDFYGWALMYQPPGMRGRAMVDADGRFADLPAVFELPLELIDRAEFLESRGCRTRPLLVPTVPTDFVVGPDGRLRNRFFPHAVCRQPAPLDGLL